MKKFLASVLKSFHLGKRFRVGLLFSFFIFSFSFSQAQWVTIPDANFRNWLNTHGFSSCMSGTMMDTTCPAVVNTLVINCSSTSIVDLSGVQYFDNLRKLNCGACGNLTNIPQLPPSLDTLWCGACNLSILPSLPNSLLSLNCNSNSITSLPSLPPNLIELYCQSNSLGTLPVLNSNLNLLWCGGCQLSNLPTLPNSLTSLSCENNSLTLFPAIPNGLKYLNFMNNHFSIFPSLPNGLETLCCIDNNLILTIPFLPTSLKDFSCGGSYSGQSPITGLPSLPSTLQTLGCNYTMISALPPLPNSIYWLQVIHNPNLTSLPTLPSSLGKLECQFNNLTSLPVIPNSVYRLFCDYNQLTSIPNIPTNCDDYFSCSNNQLMTLPTFPGYIETVNLSHNQIISISNLPQFMNYLDVSYNPGLTCLPPFQICQYNFLIDGTPLTCLPNTIIHNGYIPAIDTLPLCGIFNPGGCEVWWNIKGNVVHDGDGSCSTTNDGTGVQNVKMNLYDNSSNLLQQVYINGASDYSFNTNLGTYHVEVDTALLPFNVLCPVTNDYATTLTAIDSLDYNADFRLACKPNYDVGVLSVVNGNIFFPNHDVTLSFDAGDYTSFYGVTCNTSGLIGTVTATISGPVAISGASNSPYAISSINGNVITWTVSDFSLLSFTNTFSVDLITNMNAVAGSQVCISINVNANSGTDNNTANNSLTQCWTVVNSFDPNVKEVYPQTISSPNDWLTYTIHFQNTGTAPAENILVIDTLDSNLDWSTFQLLAYSHENLTQVLPNGIVHFNFPNIFLPDSNSNEPASHGYVQYRIKPKSTVAAGTTFENSASIYFDFNSPVVTNTITSTYCAPAQAEIVNAAICSGNSFSFNGQQYSSQGIFPVALNAVSGCDSIAELHLTVLPPIIHSIAQEICGGDVFNFNNQQLTQSGNYSATFSATGGCDSIVNLALMVVSSVSTSFNQTICNGDVFDFNGQQLSVSGNYSDTLNAQNGCDSIIHLSLAVEHPNLTVIHWNDSLIAMSEGSIQWFDCNTQQIISGATQNVFVPSSSGSYAAIISENGCSDTSSCMSFVTGVSQLTIDNSQLTVYPNPASEQLTVFSNHLAENTISVSDILGRELILYKASHSTEIINLKSFPSGIYFLKVESENGISQVKKFVKSN